MGRINTCLKRIFTIFNILFVIIGIVIIVLAGVVQLYTRDKSDMEHRTQGLIGLYTVGILTTVIALLGAYGAHKESKSSLVSFLVCMVIGGLMMFRAGIYLALARPGGESGLELMLRQLVPLDNQPDKLKDMVETLQYSEHCCGLFGDDDWKTIPLSCHCQMEEEFGRCKSVIRYKQSYSSYFHQPSPEQHFVYSKPCFPVIRYFYQLVTDIEIAIVFTLASLALLGTGLSSFMIHQLNRVNRPTVLLTASAIFNPQSPKYQELQNLPKYEEVQNLPKYEEVQNLPKYEEVQNPPQYTEH
ncbi:tetraspanin-8-like [Sphaeramia orbicularis]|uniref:Tetraspanin-8-like n=1 Tax=Sphaeramia orbicularis TaxID=375764 RepID=A0A673A599_9TELE|nr:tetraspanin-8-like [Sphaeramia orbicularis]XP_030006796.1 tetraspanin-8-like [Sphaeramia orbicularis]